MKAHPSGHGKTQPVLRANSLHLPAPYGELMLFDNMEKWRAEIPLQRRTLNKYVFFVVFFFKQAEAKSPHSWLLGLVFLPQDTLQMHKWIPVPRLTCGCQALLCNVDCKQLKPMGME